MKKKLLRIICSIFPIDSQRTGNCHRCGKCCELPKKCIFLRKIPSGLSICIIYKLRPLACRKYPRIEKESLTQNVCGYKFRSLKENVHNVVKE